jgi:hypothetical protein
MHVSRMVRLKDAQAYWRDQWEIAYRRLTGISRLPKRH